MDGLKSEECFIVFSRRTKRLRIRDRFSRPPPARWQTSFFWQRFCRRSNWAERAARVCNKTNRHQTEQPPRTCSVKTHTWRIRQGSFKTHLPWRCNKIDILIPLTFTNACFINSISKARASVIFPPNGSIMCPRNPVTCEIQHTTRPYHPALSLSPQTHTSRHVCVCVCSGLLSVYHTLNSSSCRIRMNYAHLHLLRLKNAQKMNSTLVVLQHHVLSVFLLFVWAV